MDFCCKQKTMINMSNKAKIREEAKKLNSIDDLMFRTMAEDKKFCEEILRVILSDSELTVLEAIPQYTGTNPQGRSVILDAKCVLGSVRKIDIEVQRANDDDHQKRVRYNGSILTVNLTDPGEKFKDVPDVCVAFISRFDIFKGKPLINAAITSIVSIFYALIFILTSKHMEFERILNHLYTLNSPFWNAWSAFLNRET